jgi:hypothetical protein
MVIVAPIASIFVLKNVLNKSHAPRKDEPGFEEQVKKLSDQVKLISEKLAYLSPNEQIYVLINKRKASKQLWVKTEDNLCLVSHTALKILDIVCGIWIVAVLNT